ncbi:MAG: peroxiredoxin, partial [Bacteroidetes bacterium]|nr:peroxiredoxin [Bacteroidota bacterium]
HRTTFLINEQGVISHVIDKVRTKDHAQQLLELLG